MKIRQKSLKKLPIKKKLRNKIKNSKNKKNKLNLEKCLNWIDYYISNNQSKRKKKKKNQKKLILIKLLNKYRNKIKVLKIEFLKN